MKLSTNKAELQKLNACCIANGDGDGLDRFVAAHGDNDATLSQCLESNGWDDVWWLISNTYEKFSEQQKKDLHLLGCDWAESCLHNFEIEFPNDDRPRKAIEAKRAWLNGEISDKELSAAESAASSAAESAASSATRSATSLAASLAARSAWSAAGLPARSAESAAESAESAESVVWSAESAAQSAAWSAARSAESAARSAESAESAVKEKQTQDLMNLFKKWES